MGTIVVSNLSLTQFSGSVCELLASGTVSLQEIQVVQSTCMSGALLTANSATEFTISQTLVEVTGLFQGLIAIQGITGNLRISDLELSAISDLGQVATFPYLSVTETTSFSLVRLLAEGCSYQQQFLYLQNVSRFDFTNSTINGSQLYLAVSLFRLSSVQNITISGIDISENLLLIADSLFFVDQCISFNSSHNSFRNATT